MDFEKAKKIKKKALVTGSFGQDGSYLVELLVEKGYQVAAACYPQAEIPSYLIPLKGKVDFVPLDVTDKHAFTRILKKDFYDEIYNLAAITFVPTAASSALRVKEVNEDSVSFLLNFLVENNLSTKFFQATSAYIFDRNQKMPLDLSSRIKPEEPYGISKAATFFWTKFYRRYYRLYTVSGILFNHESPRRPGHFVIPKIINQAIEIKKGERDFIELGNLNVARDWGWAPDFVQAMWLSLQQDNPKDMIIATGQAHKLTEVLDIVFQYLGIGNWQKYVHISPKLVRPNEAEEFYGDIKETKKLLKWKPSLDFKEMLIRIIKAKLNERD